MTKEYLCLEIKACTLEDDKGKLDGYRFDVYGTYGVSDRVLKKLYDEMRILTQKILTEGGYLDPETVTIEIPKKH